MPNQSRLFRRLLPALAIGALWILNAQAEESKEVTVPASAETVTAASPANPSGAPEESKTVLRQRAERYWAARQARDIRTLYELESAARPGGWLKLENAMSLQGLPVRKVRIEDIQIDGAKGAVRVSGEVMVGTIGWVAQTIKDPWILIDDQWYHETAQ